MRRGEDALYLVRILRLAAEGLRPAAIAERIGCSHAYAAKVIRIERERLEQATCVPERESVGV